MKNVTLQRQKIITYSNSTGTAVQCPFIIWFVSIKDRSAMILISIKVSVARMFPKTFIAWLLVWERQSQSSMGLWRLSALRYELVPLPFLATEQITAFSIFYLSSNIIKCIKSSKSKTQLSIVNCQLSFRTKVSLL